MTSLNALDHLGTEALAEFLPRWRQPKATAAAADASATTIIQKVL